MISAQLTGFCFSRRSAIGLCSFALAATLLTSPAQAQLYTVTDLGVLPGSKESSPAAINRFGDVAGTFDAGTEATAFRSTAGNQFAFDDLGNTPAASVTRAFAINDTGYVVGDSSFGHVKESQTRHAALFVKGTEIDLGALKGSGEFSRANGINSSLQVVGSSSEELDSPASRAFFWTQDTGMLDLGTLGGAYAQAAAINENGFSTGNSQTRETGPGEAHAFLAYPPNAHTEAVGGMLDLGTLGGRSSYGTAINAKNHVVGYSSINDGSNVHAFLHNGHEMLDLGSLAGKSIDNDQSYALGVNNLDQVVGYSYISDDTAYIYPSAPIRAPQQVAFIYRDGQMQNLNDLIGSASVNYVLRAATSINDRGQITVLAFDPEAGVHRAVLLTPTKLAPAKTGR